MFDRYRGEWKNYGNNRRIEEIKKNLPEGFLQTRVRAFSYQTLRRMWNQRKDHRLSWWSKFFKELKPQLQHQNIIKETWSK